MKIARIAGLACLLSCGAVQAQDVKIGILTEFWYSQMMDSNLRNNSVSKVPTTYYEGLSSARFQENSFAAKRAEIYCNWKISDEWAGYVMFDPNNSTSTVGNNILQDFVLTWTPGNGFTVRAGQFKMPTTYEATLVSAKEIYFFDRNQINRVFGDKRDRGVAVTYAFGDPKALQGKLNFAVSNGTTEDGSGGKNNDSNAQKDYTFRLEGGYGSDHKFGAYYRTGETSVKNATAVAATIPASWVNGAPTAADILGNREKTTLQGVYYAYDTRSWHADVEAVAGLLGRRNPLMFAAAAAPGREHLDQKFMGYAVTGVYKMGHHQIAARYDVLNYNSGDDWYTATSPYITAAGDFSPKFTETVVGYNYVFNPTKNSQGKVKLDYIFRSKNFLNPLASAGQTGAQGGNSAVCSLMIGF